MANEVHYTPVPSRFLPTGPVAIYMDDDGLTEVAVDQDQIERELIEYLPDLSTALVATLTLRNAPLLRPWGPVRLDLRDNLDLAEILPRVTPSGIIVPIPKQLLTIEVAREIGRLGTETMRWYDPPTIGG